MGKEKSCNEKKKSEYDIQYELLKVIAEQNKEKVLEYDVESDTLVAYNVVNGQFVVENRLEDYVQEKQMGMTFIKEDYREAYVRAFRACIKKPSHRVLDLKCGFSGKSAEWYRLYLVSMGEDTQAVQGIAGRLVSIQKDRRRTEEIRKKADMDELTNIYNHRAFEERCDHAISSCTSNSAFLMLDVDDFKMINDSLGHAMGDSVLSQTGKIIKSMVEGRGFAGRMGGDEFALFVSGFANKEDVSDFCRRLRKSLKTITFDIEYCCSMGVSTTKGRSLTFQDMYYEADQALYAAKNGGKNQFVLFDEMDDLPKKQEPEIVALADRFSKADMAVVTAVYRECLDGLKKPDFNAEVSRMENRLLEFFEADCVGLIRWEEGRDIGIEECHKETAKMTARLLVDSVERGGAPSLRELLNEEGELFIENVKEIKESSPKHYDHLTGCRIWSVMGQELREGIYSEGLLFAVNPRRHSEEGIVIHMLADYLAVRFRLLRLLEQQEFEVTHDHLTGLWNRNSYVLYSNRRNEEEYDSLGIVTVDFVGLAGYNKQFGYMNGNKRLVESSDILKLVFDGFRLFRYDEDEMIAVCPNVKKQDFMFLVKSLQEKAEDLDFPLSIGYSWSSHADMHIQITEAEGVMDNDKLRLLRGTQMTQRMAQAVVDEVTQMIQERMYLVYLQPKVRVKDGKTVGAEALVRQMDADIGLVSPGVFIPVLERFNVIHMVDLFVLEEIFRYQKEALDAGRQVIPISVNFSKLTILQPDLIESVRTLTQRYELPDGLIVIEVTETVGDMDHIVMDNVANKLKTLGFSLSMDDFGTHYSNLATLIQYDFDSAKIDRSMITEVTTNKKSRIVLDYMTGLINELGIECIVEGIETKEQVDIVKETKCDTIQGFYFGKPVPIDEFYSRFLAVKKGTK